MSVDQLMHVLSQAARRQIEVGCPRCLQLSCDEQLLILAAGLAQASETGLAEETLRSNMLSACGAEFAMGPLEGLGKLFADAGLVFRRRAPPAEDDGRLAGSIAAWMPRAPALIH